jgi:hypothetical protein
VSLLRSPGLRRGLVATTLAALSLSTAAPALAAPGGNGRSAPLASAVTAVEATRAPITVGGEAWTRTTDTVSGVAEGFNVDDRTGRGVFDAAVAVSGAGNWLAVNQLAGGAAQQPYVLEDGVPLTYDQILTRRKSDPLFVDVATYTDYHRLRASVTAEAERPRDVVRYDWPAPHAGIAAYPDAVVFGALQCNGGVAVPRNPISYNPHLRTLLADVVAVVRHPGQGDRRLLPPSATFALQPAPAGDRASFNDLPGVALQVPRTDPVTAQPLGGVRFPDAVVPLGRPVPVALSPVGTTSITDVCGNWGGWQPFSAAELAQRYGSVDGYLAQYAAAVDAQVRDGYLDASEKAGMLAAARAAYLAAR